MPDYPKYTIPSCKLICQAKYVIEKCGCREDGMPGELLIHFHDQFAKKIRSIVGEHNFTHTVG